MTFLTLQKDLVEEIKTVLERVPTTDPDGLVLEGFNGYENQLPVVMSDEEDTSQYFPFYIVSVNGAKTADDDSPWEVTTDIILGVHDRNKLNNGHETIMVCIQRIVDRFSHEPMLNKKYRALQDMEWIIDNEDTWPYFYGRVTIKFYVPKIGRRDPYGKG